MLHVTNRQPDLAALVSSNDLMYEVLAFSCKIPKTDRIFLYRIYRFLFR
jgi:hypothetical protein